MARDVDSLEGGPEDHEPLVRVVLDLPRLLVGKELIDRTERARGEAGGNVNLVILVRGLGGGAQLVDVEVDLARQLGGDLALRVALAQIERAVDEVAKRVRQLGVVTQRERGLVEGDVAAKGALAHQEESERVHGKAREHVVRIDHVAVRLGHLAPIGAVDEAVREHRLGQRHPRAHEQRGPNHAVEPDDVLADQVAGGRPKVRKR